MHALLRAVTVAAVFAGLGATACGGAPEPKVPEPEPEAPKVDRPAKTPRVSQELGSIDERATQQTFERLQPQLASCQRDGLKHIDYLAGDVKFFLRVGQDGRVRYAYLEESTIGDRDTEKCMLAVVTTTQWPKPEDGEAEVRKGMGFDASGDARPPADWNSDKIALVLAKQAEDAIKCKESVKGTFHITAYVVPNGHGKKKEGRVEAVGIASPSKDGEAKADCIVAAIKEWKMPSPGSYAAKVSFNL
jgi:hypothetical protein